VCVFVCVCVRVCTYIYIFSVCVCVHRYVHTVDTTPPRGIHLFCFFFQKSKKCFLTLKINVNAPVCIHIYIHTYRGHGAPRPSLARLEKAFRVAVKRRDTHTVRVVVDIGQCHGQRLERRSLRDHLHTTKCVFFVCEYDICI